MSNAEEKGTYWTESTEVTISSKIIDYQIVVNGLPRETEKQVVGFLKKGWHLHGELRVSIGQNTSYFAQVLVLHKEVKTAVTIRGC
jgi:hypothetical protein